jgi:hypothetical protein
MSDFEEVVAEHGDSLRVVLVLDMGAGVPDDEGASPLLRCEYRHGWRWEQVAEIGTYDATGAVDALNGADARPDDAGNLLRAETGATAFERWHSGECWYVTYDPADWRAQTGAPAGSISMDEWRAWCEGSVYGWELQELVTWTRGDTGDTRQEWAWLDSCSGYYGYEYAVESAREALSHYATGVAA